MPITAILTLRNLMYLGIFYVNLDSNLILQSILSSLEVIKLPIETTTTSQCDLAFSALECENPLNLTEFRESGLYCISEKSYYEYRPEQWSVKYAVDVNVSISMENGTIHIPMHCTSDDIGGICTLVGGDDNMPLLNGYIPMLEVQAISEQALQTSVFSVVTPYAPILPHSNFPDDAFFNYNNGWYTTDLLDPITDCKRDSYLPEQNSKSQKAYSWTEMFGSHPTQLELVTPDFSTLHLHAELGVQTPPGILNHRIEIHVRVPFKDDPSFQG